MARPIVEGFSNARTAAEAGHGTSGYAREIVDLRSPFGGPSVGRGYAALYRLGSDPGAPLGALDVRLVLPGAACPGGVRWVDDQDEAAELLGVIGAADLVRRR